MTAEQLKYYRLGYRAHVRHRERRCVLLRKHPDPRKESLARTYSLSAKQVYKFTQPFLDQLDRCKDDDARRVLIGAVTR